MIKRRLLILAEYLERKQKRIDKHLKVARGFNLLSWYSRNNFDYEGNCGTTACAVGDACFIPEFRRLGLHLNKSRIPAYRCYANWGAARHFFGLSQGQAEHLFGHMSYPRSSRTTPVEVAERIRDFVACAENAA